MDTLKIKSEFDGNEIALAKRDVAAPRAILQIVHGMAEHKERYYPFMEYLAGRGIATVIDDHRGHGASAPDARELGYFGPNGAEALLRDLSQISRMIKQMYPGKRLYMLGHSMGALAARAYIQRFGGALSGLIVSGNPGYSSSAPWGIKLAQRAQRRRGTHARCHLLTLGMFAPFYMRAPALSTINGWVCGDRQVVREYDSDPLCGFEFYANGYEALLTLMTRAYDPKASFANVDMPVKFFSGAKDACMGGEKGLMRAVDQLKAAGFARVDACIYPGMRHEILNERDKMRVYGDMADTLDTWLAQVGV